MLEQLNALLRQREAQEQKIQMEIDENGRDDADPSDRIGKQKFAPSTIRSGKQGGDEPLTKPLPARTDYVFERQSFAP